MLVIYHGKELIRFKEKSGGKNKSEVDGFYEDADGERYFIKKPSDKRELFAELFAGLMLQEFMKRKLIDEVYFPSLIVADFVPFEDGSYGLIQPMVSFTELHKIIGTSYSNGSDRDVTKEALYGPRYYSALIQHKYFGLSTALMFSLLLGAHSVHSGNMVALNNETSKSIQYGRLDWGDAFRYFAHPLNNDNLLYAYENRGWFNYKKLTKDYFLNYRLIPGLFPAIGRKGILLTEQLHEDTLLDIVISTLKNIPSDFIGQEIKNDFAQYASMESFKEVTFGPESNGGQFAIDMAKILKGRLEKITQLQDLVPHAVEQDMYQSVVVIPPLALSMEEGLSFPELLSNWNTELSKNGKAVSIETQQINLSQLASDFNDYLQVLAAQSDQVNLWKHNPESSDNLFAPFNKKDDGQVLHGHAFVAQYKESTVFRHLFSLDPKTIGTLRFAAYEQPTLEYTKKFPDSPWDKMQRLISASHDVIQTIRLIQNGQNYSLEGVVEENLSALRKSLQSFMLLKTEVDTLFKNGSVLSEASSSSFFYPIDDPVLNELSGDQLATICLEELNNPQPSLLVARIIKNDALWQKLNESLMSEVFYGRVDNPKEKIAKICEWRQLFQASTVLEKRPMTVLVREDKRFDEVHRLEQMEDEDARNKEKIILLQQQVSGLELLKKEVLSKETQLKEARETLARQVSANEQITGEQSRALQRISELTLRVEQVQKVIKESAEAQKRYEQAVNDKREVQFARSLKIAPVLTQLDYIEKKAQDLDEREEKKAFNAADTLVRKMRGEVKSYINSDESEEVALASFKTNSKKLIIKANKPLAEHRQRWKYILANLSLAVLSVGVGYLIASLINKGINDRFTFFSVTKSKELLEELQNSTMILSY